MKRIFIGLLFSLFASAAIAQGCGPTNPNCIVPTAPVGTNNNQAASTAFVQDNTIPAVSILSCGADPTGVVESVTFIQTCEHNRPIGSILAWPPGTYKITGQITAEKAGSWDMQGATINITSLPGPPSPNGQGGLTGPISNFVINGGGSTLNFVPGDNVAATFFSAGKYSRLGLDPIFQAYTMQNSSLAAGAQIIANSGTSTCASGTYTVSGGTGTPATLTGVATAGVITSLTTLTAGNYTVFPPNPAPLTGTGCSGAPTANLVSASNIHVGDTSFVAARAQDAATLSPDDWIAVFHLDPGTMPGTGTSNWIKVEMKQVVSVTGSTTVNVSVPFAQPFSVGSSASGCLDEVPAGTSCWPDLWVKMLNPITNVGVNNLTINATSVAGGTIGIDSDIGVINGDYHDNTINISGLSIEAFFNYNLNYSNNKVIHEDTRGPEIAVTTGGRISGNTIGSQGTGNTYCLYLDDGVFGMRVDHNQCYGRVGGGSITVQDSSYNTFDHNIVVCGATPGIGILMFSGVGNLFDGDTIINCVEGFAIAPDTVPVNGNIPASYNTILNAIVRNASAEAIIINAASSTSNAIINLNVDSTVPTPIVDSGTGTIKMNNLSGAWTTGPRLTVSGPDSATIGIFAGGTRGIRIGADGTGANIQGVDNPITAFQPLAVAGSTLSLQSITAGAPVTALSPLALTHGTPTIASGACGTGANGSVAGTNQTGVVTIGAAATTTCTVSFSATLGSAPKSCVLFPANAAAAAAGTTVAYVSSITTAQWVITGSALANAAYEYHCI